MIDIDMDEPRDKNELEDMLDSMPESRPLVIRRRYKTKRGKTVVSKINPGEEEDENENPLLPEPVPVSGPSIKSVKDPEPEYVQNQLQGVEHTLAITKEPGTLNPNAVVAVTKSNKGDGSVMNISGSKINPKNITSTWQNGKKAMTLDEEIWIDNELKRKAKEAAKLERKRARMSMIVVMPEIPGPSSRMHEPGPSPKVGLKNGRKKRKKASLNKRKRRR